jgi:hypothetical protein
MSETVNVVIAGTPTPIVLFDSNTLEAANQATQAIASAASAAASAANAEAFTGPTYASIGAGEAATTNGQYFAVNDAGIVSIYLRTVGGSTFQRTVVTDEYFGTFGKTFAANSTLADARSDLGLLPDAKTLGLCDGTDKASALATLVNAGTTRIEIAEGDTIDIDTLCSITTNADLIFLGRGTIDCSGGGRIEIVGTQSSLPALSANLARGARQIVFASAHGLAAGDNIVLHDATDFSGGLARDYYHEGWRGKVASVVNSTTVKIYGRLPCALTSAATDCYKVNGGKVDFSDIKVVPNATTYPPILIARRNGVKVKDVRVPDGSGYSNFNIVQCFNVYCSDPESTASTSDAYPMNIASCQGVILENVIACFSTRHATAIGGGGALDGAGGTEGMTPARDIIAKSCIFRSSGDIGAGDLHGATFNATYSDCTFDPGANIGGGDITFDNCRFTDMAGLCARMTEIDRGYVNFNDCVFETHELNASEGIVFFLTHFQRGDVDLVFNNPQFIHRGSVSDSLRNIQVAASIFATWNATSGTFPASPTHSNVYEVTGAGTVGGISWSIGDYAVYSSYGGGKFHKSTKPKIRVTIKDGLQRGITAGQFLVQSTGTQVMDSRLELNIDKFDGAGGDYFLTARAEHGANCKMRLPRQTISEDFTVGTGSPSAISASFNTFKYVYPRLPHSHANSYLKDGSFMAADMGEVVTKLGSLEANRLRFWVYRTSGTAWAASTNIRSVGEVWIDNL